jgi:chromosomal replication initiator protein
MINLRTYRKRGGGNVSVSNPTRFKPNPHLTFAEFVEGPSNREALAAAREVIAGSRRFYNPLVIVAGAPLGKTHLLHAIHAELLKSGARILRVDAQDFADDLALAMSSDELPLFVQNYRELDALMVDDMQALAGNDNVQEQFLDIYDALYEKAVK